VQVLLDRGVSNATKPLVETTLKRRAGKNIERLREDGDRRAPWMYRALPGEREAA
jgi:hypothetical protein